MQVTAVLSPDEDRGYVAYNPETGTVSQGESVQEALVNLREAMDVWFEECPMRKLVAEGIASGVIDAEPEAIIEQLISEIPAESD